MNGPMFDRGHPWCRPPGVRSSGGLGNTGKVRLGRSPLWWLAEAVVVVLVEADQLFRPTMP
jgi:hypothetical protein